MKNVLLLKPENFEIKPCFIGSGLPSREAQIVASNIVMMQRKINSSNWTPFSKADYKRLCTHFVSEKDLAVIDMLAGANPGEVSHHAGFDYLIKTENDEYLITPKFIEMISKFSINN